MVVVVVMVVGGCGRGRGDGCGRGEGCGRGDGCGVVVVVVE